MRKRESDKVIILKFFFFKCLSSEKDIVLMHFDNENPIVTKCFTNEKLWF